MSRTFRVVIIILTLAVIAALSFSSGYTLGTKTEPTLAQGLDVAAEAWDLIFQNYVDRDGLDSSLLGHGAIKGMIEALDDPHTAHLDAETYQEF